MFFKNNKGFSLVEVLMAAGLASGVALTVAKISQNSAQVSKTAETNMEINSFMNDISFVLSDRANCNATMGFNTPIGQAVPAIRRNVNGVTTDVYEAGTKKYGQGNFSITNMMTQASGSGVDLVLRIKKENKIALGGTDIIKRLPIKAVINSGKIESCFSDIDSMIESAVQLSCKGNSARWDPVSKECHHSVVVTVCPSGQVMQQIETAAGVITNKCVPIIPTPMNCPAGQFLKSITINGVTTCSPIETADSSSCTVGQYARRIVNGNLECIDIPKCGPKEFLRSNAAGNFYCQGLSCDSTNQYFAGFDASGGAICKNFPDKTCGPGQYITKVLPSGVVECGQVPNHASLAKSDYSFVDGYDAATNTWSRKDINSIAAQVCSKMVGFTWTGTQCAPPTAVPTEDRWTHTANSSTLTINGAKYVFKDSATMTIAPSGQQPTISLAAQNSWGADGGVVHLSPRGSNAEGETAYHTRLTFKGVQSYNYPVNADDQNFSPTILRGRVELSTEHGLSFNPSITSTNYPDLTNNASCSDPHKGRMRIARVSGTNNWRFFACVSDGSTTVWKWKQFSM